MNRLKLLFVLMFMAVMFSSTPQEVTSVNVLEGTFSLVWYSSEAEVGYIKYGTNSSNLDKVAYDLRGQDHSDKIHVVKALNGIQPNTIYYFSINSGGIEYKNNNQPYALKTAKISLPSEKRNINVLDIFKYGSSVAKIQGNAVIFIKLVKSNGENSAPISILRKTGNTEGIYDTTASLSNIRSKSGELISIEDADTIKMYAWTADEGFGGDVSINPVDITNAMDDPGYYLQNITLNRATLTNKSVLPKVTGVSATPGVERITLNWTASTKAEYNKTLVLRKEGSYPTTTKDGTVIYNGIARTTTDVGLTGNVKYYYGLYANNRNIYGDIVTVSATALEQPIKVTNVSATPGVERITLNWTASTKAGYTKTLVVRKEGSYPTTTKDGTVIYNGIARTTTDVGLTGNVKYYYGLYANNRNIYGDIVTVSATALEQPIKVTNVSATPGVERITLNWTASTKAGYTKTLVVRKEGSYPTTTKDGTVIYNGIARTNIDTKLTGGTTYYYGLYANNGNIYGDIVTVSATALSPTPIVINDGAIIDDFEDAKSKENLIGDGGLAWYYFNDNTNGGNSSATIVEDNADHSGAGSKSIKATYTLGTNAYKDRFAGIATNLTSTSGRDISRFLGIKFDLKGSGKKLGIMIPSSKVHDYNDYSYTIDATPADWTEKTIYFKNFVQEDWGEKVSLDAVLKAVKSIQFKATSKISGETGSFRIDNLRFVTNDLRAPGQITNLVHKKEAGNISKWTWTPPKDRDYDHVIVLRSSAGYPTFDKKESSVTGSLFSQESGVNGKQYYSFYTLDKAGNMANPLFKVIDQKGKETGAISVRDQIIDADSNKILINNDYVDKKITVSIVLEIPNQSNNKKVFVRVYNNVIAGETRNNVKRKSNIAANKKLISEMSFVTAADKPVITLNIKLNLEKGINELSFPVEDWNSNTNKNLEIDLRVLSLMPGTEILFYPAPYDPRQGDLSIAYHLNKNGNVILFMYNLNGELVWRETYSSGFEGGKEGYNEVKFSGTDAFGYKLGNGLYIIKILDRDKRLVGTGKMMVIR